MRDRALGSTIRLMFNTTNPDGGGAPVAPSSAFAASDIRIYKDGSATEKTSTNGITVTSPFDSVVGLHLVEIDTSNSTGDTGFWASGSVYQVRLVTAKTVATYSVSGLPIGEFSLEVQTADVRKFGGTAITQSGGRPEVNVSHIGGDAQSLADLKDFADAGYDPSTNKLTGAVELDPTVETKITNIENASGYLLAVLAGACADPQTASETYAITVFGSTFTVDMAGQTSTGTRTAPTLTKS